MKHLLLSLALILSFSISSEEYICSTIFNSEVETIVIKRKDNYFLAQLIGGRDFYKFDVIVENDYAFTMVKSDVPVYLIIYQINKQSLTFIQQAFGETRVIEGKCVLRD